MLDKIWLGVNIEKNQDLKLGGTLCLESNENPGGTLCHCKWNLKVLSGDDLI